MTDGSSTTAATLARRTPHHASLSPDGTLLLLTTAHVAPGAGTETMTVSIVDVATGDERLVPCAGAADHTAVWSPTGDRFVFTTETADGTALAVAGRDGAGAIALSGTSTVAGAPAWSPDGTLLAVPMRRGTTIDRSAPYRWTRPIAAFDGLGPLEDPPQLAIVAVDGGTVHWCTDDGWRWSSPVWAPDGRRIAATVSIDPEGRRSGSALRIVDVDGGEHPHDVPAGRSAVPAWLPDGRLAVLVAEPRTSRLGGAAALFVVDGRTTRRIDLPDLFGDVYGDHPALLPETYDNTLLSDGTGRLVVRTGRRGRLGVARLDPDRPDTVEVLAGGDRCCTPVAAHGDTVVVTTQSAEHAPDVAVLSAPAGAPVRERALTRFADGLPAATVRRFTSTTPDGFELDGWFLSPPDADGPLPTVVIVHGGPQFTFGECFHLDAQALCAAGFGVLYTNPRGSTGYGDEFAFAVLGDWADGPSRDVLLMLDHAIAAGLVDPARVGIAGNSYGGYLSAWLASTTDRFRAAVPENPVTDLAAMYMTSDIGATFFPAHFGGTPHEVPDVYRAQSPISVAHRCITPCLFITGELDRRCPPAQAFAMHRILTLHGTPSEVLVLPGSSHEGSTYGPVPGRLAADDALVEWFRRWM